MFRATDQDPSLGHFIARKEAPYESAAPPLAGATGEGETAFEFRHYAETGNEAAARILRAHANAADGHVYTREEGGDGWAVRESVALVAVAEALTRAEKAETDAAALRAKLATEGEARERTEAEFQAGAASGDVLLSWALRYCPQEELEYLFGKLSRRTEAGKALVAAADATESGKLALHEELRGLRAVLWTARLALENSYDVTDWPADGTSQQAKAIEEIKEATAKSGAGPLLGEEGKEVAGGR